MNNLILRNASDSDYIEVITSVDRWWGGRNMSPMLPRLFFQHFRSTSFVVSTKDAKPRIVAFLIGFLSQTNPEESYIHFVGVDPDYRKQGIGEELYSHFFSTVRKRGCSRVFCVTAPVNKTSIAFHKRMGFTVMPGDSLSEDGIPMTKNYDGENGDRVKFVKDI